jgi:ABC-type transporter Mla maintaining outer membrane lipid asymmetry ATPase subunit MlaF
LRIASLGVERTDRVAIAGLDAVGAEVFLNLITGAAVADEGTVRVGGADTRAIATDTDWLRSLDRFGLVTDRAVFVGSLSLEANLALPLTLSIDPIESSVRARVAALAADVGLGAGVLAAPAGGLDAASRARAHLARAAATDPEILLLEHPTATFAGSAAARAFGEALARLADARGLGWIAVSDDGAFVRAAGGTRLTLDTGTGRLRRVGTPWWAWFSS